VIRSARPFRAGTRVARARIAKVVDHLVELGLEVRCLGGRRTAPRVPARGRRPASHCSRSWRAARSRSRAAQSRRGFRRRCRRRTSPGVRAADPPGRRPTPTGRAPRCSDDSRGHERASPLVRMSEETPIGSSRAERVAALDDQFRGRRLPRRLRPHLAKLIKDRPACLPQEEQPPPRAHLGRPTLQGPAESQAPVAGRHGGG
jgi:hypothetical protein